MTKVIYFDIDDTLYNQIEPFRKAFEKNFWFLDIDIEDVFKTSRKLSDEVFEKSETGILSMDEMQIYRIKNALQLHGIQISNNDALQFQKDYSNFQNDIELSRNIEGLFEFLTSNDVIIGIISNGPSKHQWSKISNLNLERWIPKERMIISSDVGFAKPNKKIFDLAQCIVSSSDHDFYYVGDSFLNDIIGAKQAGWHSIWYNHRKRIADNESVASDFVVENEEELIHLLKEIISKKND
ncbi:TPA: HAD family hydrolase [Streptococcus suis]|nr:HAD family hydrolase [Streptococcus suis]